MDQECHSSSWHAARPTTSFNFVRVLQEPTLHEQQQLPKFDRLVLVRRRCEITTSPPVGVLRSPTQPNQNTRAPPRLCKLAADAVLPELLRNDPPWFLDPVDCVFDAVLVAKNRTLVHDNVVCYVKFLPCWGGEPTGSRHCWHVHHPALQDVFVNPEMLEQLDWIITTGERRESLANRETDPQEPLRVLVFVRQQTIYTQRIDESCLPTHIPSIVVQIPHFGW